MDRKIEFTQYYYDWIVKCLRVDNKLETLAFFMLGCDIGVRQKELASITWKQLDFPYINNVQVFKVRNNKTQDYYYPLKFSSDTASAIHVGCTNKCEKLFSKDAIWYVDQIRKSCGDDRFSGHDMRRIAAIKRLDDK